MKDWFAAFLNWIQTSRIGQKEMHAKNNHGVWYDAQSLSMALFIDSVGLAEGIVMRAAEGSINKWTVPAYSPWN